MQCRNSGVRHVQGPLLSWRGEAASAATEQEIGEGQGWEPSGPMTNGSETTKRRNRCFRTRRRSGLAVKHCDSLTTHKHLFINIEHGRMLKSTVAGVCNSMEFLRLPFAQGPRKQAAAASTECLVYTRGWKWDEPGIFRCNGMCQSRQEPLHPGPTRYAIRGNP